MVNGLRAGIALVVGVGNKGAAAANIPIAPFYDRMADVTKALQLAKAHAGPKDRVEVHLSLPHNGDEGNMGEARRVKAAVAAQFPRTFGRGAPAVHVHTYEARDIGDKHFTNFHAKTAQDKQSTMGWLRQKVTRKGPAQAGPRVTRYDPVEGGHQARLPKGLRA